MTGDGVAVDGLAAAGRTDAPTAAPLLASAGTLAPAPVRNPVREKLETALRVLESLRQPTLEQLEKKQFLREYLARRW